jgi:hypothetical protein
MGSQLHGTPTLLRMGKSALSEFRVFAKAAKVA